MSSDPSTRQRIKEILVTSLNLDDIQPGDIADDMPLWGDGLGLDSVDALELMVALEQEYDFAIESESIDESALATVGDLAAFIDGIRATAAADAS
ncbi:MAG: phosphopantetheine-binding protein [Acidobacteriota bacterium]